MSSSPAVPEPRNLRASDADRERVANVLREAAGDGRLTMEELDERLEAVYAAKTYAELEPITRDLPDAGAAYVPAPSAAPAGNPTRFGGEPTSHGAVAIMGGFTRKGDWVVPKDFNVFCLMGGGEIDLREARFAEREVSIHILAFMGGCEITVPEDATVRVTGIGIMGAFDHAGSGTGSPDGPVITVNGLAIMGGANVKRGPAAEPATEAVRDARQLRLEARLDRHDARHQYHQERRDARRSGEPD
ncbi:MAG TPA: DUF1707 domain-containing protein [Trebonia sp.]|nr:DUF1707 domain-containing protein [Trebonia sp.]